MKKLQQRKKGDKKPEIILIISEDMKSSTFYLQDKIKSFGIPTKIKYDKLPVLKTTIETKGSKDGSARITVVKYAIKEKNKFNKIQKRNNSEPFSKVYCVMDVDDDPTLKKAKKIIEIENRQDKTSEIIPIISNECFEVWYVLHFEYPTRELERKKKGRIIKDNNRLDKLIEKYLDIEEYDKAKNIFTLINKKGDESLAIKNAEKLNKHHLNTNKISEDKIYTKNPSTQIAKRFFQKPSYCKIYKNDKIRNYIKDTDFFIIFCTNK